MITSSPGLRRSLQCVGTAVGALATIALCTPADAVAAQSTLPAFSDGDVFGLEWATDPQMAPDGRQIAYVRQSMDIRTDEVDSTVWIIDIDGRNARPLLRNGASSSTPRWSPDGTRIAYVGRDDDGSSQIFVRWLGNGAAARITRLVDAPSSLVWSPDGSQLAFTMLVEAQHKPLKVQLPEVPKGAQWAAPPKIIDRMVYRADGKGYLPNAFRQVFIVDAQGGAARALTRGDFNNQGTPAFTADGKTLLTTANRRADADYEPLDTEIYALRISDGSLTALTNRRGPDSSPVMSPDGRHIAYLGFDDTYQGYQSTQVYVMDSDGSNSRALTPHLDRDAQDPQWTQDGRAIAFQYDDRGSTRIAAVSLQGAQRVLADDLGGADVTRPYSGGSFSIARNGRFAYTRSTALQPAALATGTSLKDMVTLSHFNTNSLGTCELGQVEEIHFQSSADQRDIQGWLMRPPGFDPAKKYPLILEIHGGPFASYGGHFAAELQLYAAAGYVVLYLNPRGSTGYGEQFANLINHAYPGHDYDDLMSGVDAVLSRGFIDPQRLFVTGGSGGGVLTAWIVGHTARFRAAAVVKPVINWTSFVLTADQTNYFYRYWFEGFPWDQQNSYWKRSPLAYAGNVQTPTLVMTGEVDYRTPSSEAEQFYQALRLRKIDTALVRVPGASHDISARPSLLVAKVAYILAWFRAHDSAAVRPAVD